MKVPERYRETGEREEGRSRTTVFSCRLLARAEPYHSWSAEFEVPVFRRGSPPEPPVAVSGAEVE